MRFKEIILGVFLAFGLCFSPLKAGAEPPLQIIEKLDRHYYYPQHHGLEKLAARVRLQQLDVSSKPGKYLPNPEFIFHWDSSPEQGGKYFTFSDDDFERSKTREQELLTLIENYKEMIIPLTLKERFTRYKGRVLQERNNKFQLDFKSRELDDPIRKYSLLTDQKKMFIQKMKIYRANPPREVRAELSYIKKDGLWLLFESTSNFEMKDLTFVETAQYTYQRVQSFWLVSKMKQTVKLNNQIIRSFIFRVNDYRLN